MGPIALVEFFLAEDWVGAVADDVRRVVVGFSPSGRKVFEFVLVAGLWRVLALVLEGCVLSARLYVVCCFVRSG